MLERRDWLLTLPAGLSWLPTYLPPEPYCGWKSIVIEPVSLLGVPVDFILFGLTLIGVAIWHHHTLLVAVTGLAAIASYKLAFTGFEEGPGLSGLALHMQHDG